jgi:hypothetical protein
MHHEFIYVLCIIIIINCEYIMHNINRFGTGDTACFGTGDTACLLEIQSVCWRYSLFAGGTACLLQCTTLISSIFIHYLGQTQVKAEGLIS